MKKTFIFMIMILAVALMAKGTCEPAGKGEPAAAVLDLSLFNHVNSETDPQKVLSDIPENTRDWQTIKEEGFEGAWPNEWDCYSSTEVDCYWSDDSNNSSAGSWSGWCADGGYEAPTEQEYLISMNSWMVYGPFSLADAIDAELWYDVWYEIESNYDYFKILASTNGVDFYGTQWTGDSEGWDYDQEFDLTDVYTLGNLAGENQVWIAFNFTSDGSICYEGVYVDEVSLIKNYDYPEYYGAPDIYSVSVEEGTDNNSNGYYEQVWLEVDVDAVSAGRATYRAEDCYISIYTAHNGAFVGEWGPFAFNDYATNDNVILGPIQDVNSYSSNVTFEVECSNYLGSDTHTCEVAMEPLNTDEDPDMITSANSLIGNYPNPFNPQTFISFSLANDCQASIKIYNVKGELVKNLVDGLQSAGTHSISWNGIDRFGKQAASGIYYYKLITSDFTATRRMIMLK